MGLCASLAPVNVRVDGNIYEYSTYTNIVTAGYIQDMTELLLYYLLPSAEFANMPVRSLIRVRVQTHLLLFFLAFSHPDVRLLGTQQIINYFFFIALHVFDTFL